MRGGMLIRSHSGCLDDPLLEFIAQLIAHELAAESARAGTDQQPAAQEDPST